MPPLGELVRIDGRHLHCVRSGIGEPLVVFESGGGGRSSIQDLPILRLVSRFTRGCVYDRAGYGWSAPAPPGRSFVERSTDLHALLGEVGESPPYVLVGLSFGSLLARAFCQLAPNEVVGMVLVDAAEEQHYFTTMSRMRPMHEDELKREAHAAASGEVRERLERALGAARSFSDNEKAAVLEVVARPSHFVTALEELSAIDTTLPEMQLAGGFGSFGSRPLVVLSHGKPFSGEMSPWEKGFMEGQKRLAALSTSSAHIIASRCGHSIGLEKPELVAAAIEAVVNATKGGRLDTSAILAAV